MSKIPYSEVVVSVVSHGHGVQIFQLMCRLETLCFSSVGHLVLTVNVPEPELVKQLNSQVWSFRVTIVQNGEPKGFGANHNAAFKHASLKYFCVVNPDIDFDADPFPQLVSLFSQPLTGCAFPVQLDEDGQIQDYARKLPSPSGLLLRYLWLRSETRLVFQPEWVNGAFMLFPTEIFWQLSGFDEDYFMYCEDVDICLRLQLAGYGLAQSSARVTHAAHRNSRINFRHLAWHIGSLVHLWCSAPYRQFCRTRRGGQSY